MDPLDLWKSLANHLELTWEVDPIGRVINVGEEFSIFFKLRNTAAATDEWGDDVRPDIAFGEPKLRIIPRGEVDLFTDNGSLTSTGATFRFPHVGLLRAGQETTLEVRFRANEDTNWFGADHVADVRVHAHFAYELFFRTWFSRRVEAPVEA